MDQIYEIPKEYLGNRRDVNTTDDEKNMLMALAVASRSSDPSTQVGSIVVDKDGTVLSVGYNSSPKGWNDEEFPWGNDRDIDDINKKYPYVIHAEMNAITNYKGPMSDFNDATIYVTLFPCSQCSKLITQVGIKHVIYLYDDRKEDIDNMYSKILLSNCGVTYTSFNELTNSTNISVNLGELDYNNIKIKTNYRLN